MPFSETKLELVILVLTCESSACIIEMVKSRSDIFSDNLIYCVVLIGMGVRFLGSKMGLNSFAPTRKLVDKIKATPDPAISAKQNPKANFQ